MVFIIQQCLSKHTKGSRTLSTFADDQLYSIQITLTSSLKKIAEEEVRSVCATLGEAFNKNFSLGKKFSFGYRSYNTLVFSYTENEHGVFTATKEKKGAQDGYKVVLNITFDDPRQVEDIVSKFPRHTAENNYSFKFLWGKPPLRDEDEQILTASTHMPLSKFIKNYSEYQKQFEVHFPKFKTQRVHVKFRFLAEDDDFEETKIDVIRTLTSWKMITEEKKK